MNTLNKELILKVADEIEAMPHAVPDPREGWEYSSPGFNLSDWHLSAKCGTVCCIGGHVAPRGDEKDVARAFGISVADAYALCFPSGVRVNYDKATPADAARVLRHLAQTGKVDWSVASES